jgi:membrane-associated phospholipid phosphatase
MIRSIFFILAIGVSVCAQTPPRSLERDFFKNILNDQKAIWTAPLHLERSDAKWVIPSSIGFMALVTTDRITGDEMGEFDGQLKASRIVSQAGSIYALAGVSGAFYLVGRNKHDDRARETGLLSAEAMVDSGIVEGALKVITQRGRPADGRDRSEFFDHGSSFPSGHSTQAWAVATVIANEYKDRRAVRIAAYGTATAVSIARFTGQKHYLSDIVAGSALGYMIGRYVYNTHHRSGQVSQVTIFPQFNRAAHAYGLSATWRF